MLVLASASPRRLDLLKQAGIVPGAVVPADIDETPLPREKPEIYVRRIAAAKADKVVAAHANDIVLAADTIVAVGLRILRKTETEDEARTCLALLSGRRHRVLTAVAVRGKGKVKEALVSSVVRFKRLSAAETDAYIASGEWRGKAGGYAVQGTAAAFIPFIGGSYSNIVGLPLYETLKLLKSI